MLEITENVVAGRREICCRGELDYGVVDKLSAVLADLAGGGTLAFDFSQLMFVDSTGLSSFVPKLYQLIGARTRVVLKLNRGVFEVLDMLGILDDEEPYLTIQIV